MQVFKYIYLLGGVGYDSNIYLIDNELILDTGTGLFFKEIKDEMENSDFDLTKFKMIVNTHCHFDHVGGNKKFRDWLKLKIAAHEMDKHAIETGDGMLNEMFAQDARVSTVDITLHDDDVIETEHFNFIVLSTPGHTPGSICLYEPDKKIMFSGDTIFSDGIGRTDLKNGNFNDMMQTLRKLSRLNLTSIFPGHGQPKFTGGSLLIKQLAAHNKLLVTA